MSKTMRKALPYFILVGYLMWLSSFILPENLLGNTFGGLRWGGIVTLYICPIMGIIGAAGSLLIKKLPLAILSVLLIFSFFISWGLSSFFMG